VLVTTGQVEMSFLLLAVLVAVAATAIDMPIGRTLVFESVGSNRLVSGTALNSIVLNLFNVAGPVAFGLVIGMFGVDVALYVLAGAYGVAALTVLPRKRSPASEPPRRQPAAELIAGFAYLRSAPGLARLVSLAFLVPFAGVFFAVVPMYARDVLHVGAGGLGVLLAVYGLGSLTGSSYLLLHGRMRRRGMAVGALGFAFSAGMLIFALSPLVLVSAAVAFVLGATAMLWQNTLSTMVQGMSAPEMRGRVMSVYTMGIQLVSLGWLMGGLLASAFGPMAALILAAAGFSVLNLAVLATSKEVRDFD
jgi:predicted MFS family arabinose efflux permease